MANKLQTSFVLNADDRTSKVLNGVSGRFKKLDHQAKQLGGALKSNVALAAAGAAAGLAFMSKKAIDNADRIGKLSKKIGASTEFLSQMQFVAEQSGISFESLQGSMSKMQKTIGEAGQGMGTATKGFEALNLSVGDLKQLSPEDQFDTIQKALSGVEDRTERAAIATQIFGRSGQELAQLGDDYEKLRQEADKLGKTISATDAAKAEAFNDAMNRLKTSIQGVVTDLTLALLPAFQVVVDGITKGVGWLVEKWNEYKNEIIYGSKLAWLETTNIFASGVDTIKRLIIGIQEAFDRVMSGILPIVAPVVMKMIDLWQTVAGAMLRIFEPVLTTIGDLFTKLFQFMLSGVEKFIGKLADAAEFFGFDGVAEDLRGAADSVSNFGNSLDIGQSIENAIGQFDGFVDGVQTKAQETADAFVDGYNKRFNQRAQDIAGLDTIRTEREKAAANARKNLQGERDLVELSQATIDIIDTPKIETSLAVVSTKIKTFTDGAKAEFNGLKDSIGDAFADALFEGKNFADSLGDIFKGLAKNLFSMGFSALLGSIIPGGGIFGAKASGGSVYAGKSYLVGEAGRELFTPATNGYITNNRDIRDGGATTVQQIVNINVEGVSIDNPHVMRKLAEMLSNEQQQLARTYRS